MSPPRRTQVHPRDQRGFAIPMVLMVLAIMVTLVGAAALTAVSATNVSRTNVNALRAQQAADAGLRAALYEYSSLASDVGALFTDTAGKVGEENVVDGGCYKISSEGVEEAKLVETIEKYKAKIEKKEPVEWCPPATNSLGDGVTYSYVISPPTQAITRIHEEGNCLLSCKTERESTLTRTVVSTGSTGNEKRVVEEEARMVGVSIKSCGLLILCAVEHAGITQYYEPVRGSYRQCSIAAASVAAGLNPTSKC